MNDFRQILEIEKKYENIISNAQKKAEKSLEKYKEELSLKLKKEKKPT